MQKAGLFLLHPDHQLFTYSKLLHFEVSNMVSLCLIGIHICAFVYGSIDVDDCTDIQRLLIISVKTAVFLIFFIILQLLQLTQVNNFKTTQWKLMFT